MRITLDLDPEKQKLLAGFAEANCMSRSKAASHFLRTGLQNPPLTHLKNGLHVVSIPPGSKRTNITAERIRKIEDEMDLEYALRASSRAKQL